MMQTPVKQQQKATKQKATALLLLCEAVSTTALMPPIRCMWQNSRFSFRRSHRSAQRSLLLDTKVGKVCGELFIGDCG
jgi:hypothetical protein